MTRNSDARHVRRAFCLVVWILTAAGWFFFDSGVFFAAFCLLPAAVLLSFCLQCAVLRHIAVEVLSPPTPVQKTQPIPARLRLHSTTVIPVHLCTLTVTCRNDYTEEETQIVRQTTLSPKGCAEIAFDMTAAHCGYLQAQVRSVAVTDWFGLFSRAVSPKDAVSAGTPVLPDVYPLSGQTPQDVSAAFAPSERLTAKKGPDLSQDVRLRAFAPGDTLRQVHWKLSEKSGEWITREGAAEGRDALLLFWDPSGSTQSPADADALAAAVASVCCALMDSGVPFRFAWTLSDDTSFTEPVTEQAMYARLLEAVRRRTDAQPIPDARFDGSRVLYFSVHRPDKSSDNMTYIHCDDGCPSPAQPFWESIV